MHKEHQPCAITTGSLLANSGSKIKQELEQEWRNLLPCLCTAIRKLLTLYSNGNGKRAHGNHQNHVKSWFKTKGNMPQMPFFTSQNRVLTRWSMVLLGTLCLPCALPAQTETPAKAQTDAPQIVSDTSQLEVLSLFSKQADAAAKEWYPRIVELLGAKDSKPPRKITLIMDFNYKGVAATSGTQIAMSPEWIRKHPDDLGMVVHELTHVVQGYPKYDPVWLVEGIADWVRWFNFEPVDKRPHPNPDKATARDSYRTTGAFLDWTLHKYDKNLVKKLDAALKADTYKESLWHDLTGKTLDDLNTEWIAALKASATK